MFNGTEWNPRVKLINYGLWGIGCLSHPIYSPDREKSSLDTDREAKLQLREEISPNSINISAPERKVHSSQLFGGCKLIIHI